MIRSMFTTSLPGTDGWAPVLLGSLIDVSFPMPDGPPVFDGSLADGCSNKAMISTTSVTMIQSFKHYLLGDTARTAGL